MDYTIYAFWNGTAIYDVLNSVVLVTGGAQGDAYRQLMISVALVAIFVSLGVGLARLRATDTATAFMALTFFYGIFFLPTVTVYIDDVRKNQNYTVSNVPLGLALFGSVTSHIGWWLTETYETYFTAVDDEKFSHYGFLFGNRLVEELPMQEFMDPRNRHNMTEFVKNCVNPELVDNPAALTALVKSNDVWQFLSGATAGFSLNPGRITMYVPSSGTATAVPCSGTGSAVELLGADGLADALTQLTYLGNRLHPGNATAASTIDTQVSNFESTLLGITRNAQETLRHYSMINMLRNASEQQGAIFASTAAAAQLNTSYLTMKTVAEGALPKLRNMIEIMIYAVFPIVFLIVIAAGALGGKVLTMYAMTAIWIHLWAPLYAVINSIMFNASRDAMNQVTGGTGGTIENMSHLLQMTVSDQGMAGLMVISVPAIALAIVKGGAVAMSGVVNSLMSPAQSAAARVGSEVGMGNVSSGRVQWGGATFDSSVTRRGNFTTEEMGSFKAHYDSGGNLMSVSGGAASIGGEASQARQRVASAGREVASTQQQVAEKLTQLTSALEQSDQFRATRAMQEALSTTGGRNMEAMGGGQTSSAQIGTTTQTNRMGTVAAQDKTDALRMEGGVGTQGTGSASGFHGGNGKPAGAIGGSGPALLRAAHLLGMIKGGLTGSTQESDNFRQQMENLNSLDGAKRSEAQNFMRNASGFFMRTAGEMKDSSTREAMYNLASSLKDSVSASERLSQSISDAQKAGVNVSDTSAFSANAKVNSETAAVLAALQAAGKDTSPPNVFAAMAGAQRAPVQEAAHLANAIPQSGSGFDAVAPAPQTPDALRASAAPGVSNAAAMYMGDVQAANAGYGGQVRDEMLEKAGFTPEQRVSAGAAIARAQAGLVAMNGEMQTQMQQARAMLGAQSAAMAIVQQEMESRGQNFNMDQGDLRSRVADYGAQILNASQNDPVLRDILAGNGAMPAGGSANYSSEDLAAIQARSGVTPRPKDEGKNLGRVSDVIAP